MASLLSLILGLVALSTGGDARAADADSPHPHQGIVEPFRGPPAPPVLDPDQVRALARGEAVLTTLENDGGGRGMAIQDIQATPATVWNRILAFREYPDMVNYVVESEPYLENGNDLRVRFVLKVFAFRFEYYIKHDFHPDQGYMSWTLDYTRESDFDDSVGYWVVQPHPEDPNQSRLFYSIDMRTRGWMPGVIRSIIARQGLKDATRWVKREAEILQHDRKSAPALLGSDSP